MKYSIAFQFIFLLFKSSFIDSTPVILNDVNVNIKIADSTIDEAAKKILKQQINEQFGGLKNIDFPNTFSKRPRGGNDDPTVNINFVVIALINS